jgi:DNA-binding CsgD family transcriptional regulator/tetratricopeptide (TPR) repeat protein
VVTEAPYAGDPRHYDSQMELWERADALDLLDQLLQQSTTTGRVALVAGEAGIGKSSLVTEFGGRSRDRARILWGACDRLVTPRALGPVHDIGWQTGGALAARLAEGAGQEQIFAASLDELSAPGQAHPVVVVEDAHWADEATLDWLAFLGRRIGRLAALLVITYRDDEVGPEHRLRRVLAALPSDVAQAVPIRPLTEECVLQQGRLAGQDGELVYRLAGGNPLLVTEVLKAGESTATGVVQNLVLERMRHLPDDARAVAQLVAVVPTRADARLIGTSDAVDACIEAGVLVPAGDGVSFRHELLRSAVEDSLSPARRAALHRQVLEILADDPSVDPGRLVHHARLSGDTDAVLRFGRIAGDSARRQGANREAADHFAAAAAYADRLDEPERAELLESYGHAAYLAGRYDEAMTARKHALAVREVLGQPEHIGENLRWISRVTWWAGSREDAQAAATRAVEVLEAAPPSRQLAMAYSNQAQLHTTAHHSEEALVWADRAGSLARQLGDRETELHAAVTAGVGALMRLDGSGFEELAHVYDACMAEGYIEHAARAICNVALTLPDEFAEYDVNALARLTAALQFTDEHDMEGYHSLVLGARARLWLERGEWAKATADVDTLLSIPALLGMNMVLPLVVRGRIQSARGDTAAVDTLAAATHYSTSTTDVTMTIAVAEARSELLLLSGHLDEAQQVARRALAEALEVSGNAFLAGRLAYRLWRAGSEDPVPDAVAEPFRQMMTGEWDKAAEEWGRRGAVYLRAEALAAGDEAAAGEALRILDRLEATRAAEFVRADMRARGVARVPRGPRRTTSANVAGLTPRQLDVLKLLVDGLSNAEIGDRLTLSTKTVDHHVSAVLHKLGVANRSQAAVAAHRLDLVD